MSGSPPPLSPLVRAEAAAWIARLRADDRSSNDEQAFRAWLQDDPEHLRAFDAVTSVWDVVGGFRDAVPTQRRIADRAIPRRAVLASLGVLTLAGGTFATWRAAYAGIYETSVGGQEHIALEDGTQAFLDTDTRIRVLYADEERAVRLDRGRVNFRVASDPKRPFVVEAANRRIIATQTTLDVYRDGDRLSVVLLRGSASVVDVQTAAAMPKVLTAGERLLATPVSVHTDRPNLTPLLAWQLGQAIFENETLADAAAEMNRYSTVKLEIDDPQAARLRISGVYRVGDTAAFARSVASLLPVEVEFADDRVHLVSDPAHLQGT
ncbi:MAG: FecR domain-containing protein [Rhizomicrobium sp.]